jgi:hypothetical protein
MVTLFLGPQCQLHAAGKENMLGRQRGQDKTRWEPATGVTPVSPLHRPATVLAHRCSDCSFPLSFHARTEASLKKAYDLVVRLCRALSGADAALAPSGSVSGALRMDATLALAVALLATGDHAVRKLLRGCGVTRLALPAAGLLALDLALNDEEAGRFFLAPTDGDRTSSTDARDPARPPPPARPSAIHLTPSRAAGSAAAPSGPAARPPSAGSPQRGQQGRGRGEGGEDGEEAQGNGRKRKCETGAAGEVVVLCEAARHGGRPDVEQEQKFDFRACRSLQDAAKLVHARFGFAPEVEVQLCRHADGEPLSLAALQATGDGARQALLKLDGALAGFDVSHTRSNVPKKRALEALARNNYTQLLALLELCDNSLQYTREAPRQVELRINEGARWFEIFDNGVGFDPGSYERFAALGARGSTQDGDATKRLEGVKRFFTSDFSKYGVGIKEALVFLGDQYVMKSTKKNSPVENPPVPPPRPAPLPRGAPGSARRAAERRRGGAGAVRGKVR